MIITFKIVVMYSKAECFVVLFTNYILFVVEYSCNQENYNNNMRNLIKMKKYKCMIEFFFLNTLYNQPINLEGILAFTKYQYVVTYHCSLLLLRYSFALI